ncbi:MAG: hypothetical protein JXA58_05105 [Dehalococcoidia bacterium]|nr:hypothetical protein [Dehalococcoidia bacterium]
MWRASAMALALLPVLVASGVAHADEIRYSLGSIQEERSLSVEAGGVVTSTLGFYNIDGNVATMMELSVVEAPDDWVVTIEYDAAIPDRSGGVTLLVEPSVPGPVAGECPEAQQEAVWLAPRGYVCADIVHVSVTIPQTARVGMKGTVRVLAHASWELGGSVAPLPQEREFVFEVVVGEAEPEASAVTTRQGNQRGLLVLVGGVFIGVVVLLWRSLAESGRLA